MKEISIKKRTGDEKNPKIVYNLHKNLTWLQNQLAISTSICKYQANPNVSRIINLAVQTVLLPSVGYENYQSLHFFFNVKFEE